MSSSPSHWQVLVVGADRAFAATLALKYGLHGHYAQVAQSGGEALELVSRFEPTLAILGAELADVTGPGLAKEIETRFPSCRIVFLADAMGSRLSTEAAPPTGRDPYVFIKSVQAESIYQEVAEMVSIDAA